MKSVTRIFSALLIAFFCSQSAYAKTEESPIMTLAPAIIVAATQCHYDIEGTWISTNRRPVEYETFITFAGGGVISEIGAFNVSQPPGSYQLFSDCSVVGIVNEEDGNTITINGTITSNTEMMLSANSMDIDFVKVSNTGACQGAWSGTLQHINPPAPPSPTIQFQVGSDGAISSFTGFAAPVSGKMYCESGIGVAHMKTGESSDFREITLDGDLSGNTLTGNYGIDNSSANDPDGTFSIHR